MRLCDAIMQTQPGPETIGSDGRIVRYPNGAWLQDSLQRCKVRYVLSKEVAAKTRQIATAHGEMIIQCLDFLRFPEGECWIEWPDRERSRLLEDMGIKFDQSQPPVDRCGTLIKADATGRRGTIWLSWYRQEKLETDGAEVGGCEILFDLDDSEFTRRHWPDQDHHLLMRANDPHHDQIAEHWIARVIKDREAFLPRDFLVRQQTVRNFGHDTLYEFQHALAFFLLLAARNKPVEEKPVEFTKLNKSRVKGGKKPLLEHVEVTLSLSKIQERRIRLATEEETGVRASPHFHYVTGHFVRRGRTVYWRSGHTRGNLSRGRGPKKTITVIP